ncbi:MAG TPA: OmpA family protein [Rhodopila sp.]|nr:OmpA family protein [Rhodopila sp.]
MRNIMAVAAISASLVIGVAYPGSAWPASDTSVQDVIDALKPHPGKSRGSKPVIAPPGSEASAPVATAPSTAMHAPVTHVTTHTATAAAQDDRPSLDFNITFATGSAELTPQATKVLDTLGKALASNELSTSKFRIEGHTDTVGTPEANKELSTRRATSVVTYLSQHYGIAPNRLEAVGMGEEALLVPTGPNVPEQRNRRVHVVNVSG